MDYVISTQAIEIIDRYMSKENQTVTAGIEKHCIDDLKSMAEEVFREKCVLRLARLKGVPYKESEFDRKYDRYFSDNSYYCHSWCNSKCGWGYDYFLKGKAVRYFEKNAGKILMLFISERYGNIENAILNTSFFLNLCNAFYEWFNERREIFLKKSDVDIRNNQEISQIKAQKSHGGVANLLKVLTKTMEMQGSDIKSIAKVQYAVCVQAGIYIPDEFIRDVAVTLDMDLSERNED